MGIPCFKPTFPCLRFCLCFVKCLVKIHVNLRRMSQVTNDTIQISFNTNIDPLEVEVYTTRLYHECIANYDCIRDCIRLM